MRDSSVKKNIGEELPQKIFLPNEDGDEAKIDIDPVAHNHL